MNPPPAEAAPPVEILLVEDSPSDVGLTREALDTAKVLNRVSVASDGEEAMAFLRREGEHAEAPRPDLILLDLNLPRKDGREVLVELKQDSSLRQIPVVVLTTSAAEEDVWSAYEHRVNAYIRKPVALEGFLEALRAVESFWLTVVTLPSGDPRSRRVRS